MAAYVALHLTVSVSSGRYIFFYSGFGDAELSYKLTLGLLPSYRFKLIS